MSYYRIFYIFLILLTACAKQEKENQANLANINVMIGYEHLKLKNYSKAKQSFMHAWQISPKSSKTNAALAYYFAITHQANYAELFFKKAIHYAIVDKGRYWNNYGSFLCSIGRYREGKKYLLIAAKDVNYVSNAKAFDNAKLCDIIT
jgi:type IV pilus assembly protein PilF